MLLALDIVIRHLRRYNIPCYITTTRAGRRNKKCDGHIRITPTSPILRFILHWDGSKVQNRIKGVHIVAKVQRQHGFHIKWVSVCARRVKESGAPIYWQGTRKHPYEWMKPIDDCPCPQCLDVGKLNALEWKGGGG